MNDTRGMPYDPIQGQGQGPTVAQNGRFQSLSPPVSLANGLRLRSSTCDQQIVPSYNLTTVDRRTFPVSTAILWNSLPAHLTSAPSLTVLRQHL